LISIYYKSLRKILNIMKSRIYTPIAKVILLLNNVQYGKNVKVLELLKLYIARRGKVLIGNNLKINSAQNHNIIGRQQKFLLWAEGKLTIKNKVRISASKVICNHKITFGNNVVIGGNTVIVVTNFHSIDPGFSFPN